VHAHCILDNKIRRVALLYRDNREAGREEWKEKRKRISVFVARIHNIVTDVRINLLQINQ